MLMTYVLAGSIDNSTLRTESFLVLLVYPTTLLDIQAITKWCVWANRANLYSTCLLLGDNDRTKNMKMMG